MKTILHKSETRGHANHGWLDTHHTFSFADYYNPQRVHFGMLRVLNDDRIAPGEGFGKHPHDNMEIITIPLYGDLEHKDSMGNHGVITTGEIQVMSAGTGIFHSEFNKNKNKEVGLLQIWVLPNKKNVTPRYDQITLADIQKPDEFYQILSPNPEDQGVWIYQNAWFHLGDLSEGWKGTYQLKDKKNGVYFFVIEGKVTVAGQELNRRDGLGVSEAESIEITTSAKTKLLVMEVPMQ
ncbi:pirin family protein [uncultured Bacteroides sp.]|uniref:pirin family protein n=1 Tax=uncultured Bacteroides sp. TaxID=162156 RepID=UPI002AAC38FE|nr:pirin family protein [uncultured Bacteroides sp.]